MLRVGASATKPPSAGATSAGRRRTLASSRLRVLPSPLLSPLTVPPPPQLHPRRRRRCAFSTVSAFAAPHQQQQQQQRQQQRRLERPAARASASSSSSSNRPSSSPSSSVAAPTAAGADDPPPPNTTTTSGPRLIHASLAARPRLCDGGLPDPDMCLIDDDDAEMRAEDLLLAEAEAEVLRLRQAAAASAAATEATTTTTTTTTTTATTTTTPQQLQQQLPLPSPLHVAPAPDGSVLDEAASRGRWLVGLLVVQSLSSVVLERFEPLIREHLAVTLFLTMLVGAGGNAGNQSAIKVVRSLATGQLDASWPSARAALARQAGVAVVLGGGLAAAGYARVVVAAALGGLGGGGSGGAEAGGAALAAVGGDALAWADASRDAAAIAVSLFAIVGVSVLLGTALPFFFARCGLDAAHSGTTIQVASDVLGVLVTCLACSFFYSGALDGVTDGIGAALASVF